MCGHVFQQKCCLYLTKKTLFTVDRHESHVLWQLSGKTPTVIKSYSLLNWTLRIILVFIMQKSQNMKNPIS